jgi:hypothetical protein
MKFLCGTVVLCGTSDNYMKLLYRTVVLFGTVVLYRTAVYYGTALLYGTAV